MGSWLHRWFWVPRLMLERLVRLWLIVLIGVVHIWIWRVGNLLMLHTLHSDSFSILIHVDFLGRHELVLLAAEVGFELNTFEN